MGKIGAQVSIWNAAETRSWAASSYTPSDSSRLEDRQARAMRTAAKRHLDRGDFAKYDKMIRSAEILEQTRSR
jgi:hypothetical protein